MEKVMLRTGIFCVLALMSAASVAAGGRDAIAQTVEVFLSERAASLPGKVSVEIGPIVDNERYDNCQQWEAFLQENVRPWGRVSVGVRCKIGENASLYVTAKIKVMGSYIVAARPIATGQALGPQDVRKVDGELSAQPPDLLTTDQEVVGQVARSFIPAERPLRQSLLKQEVAVVAGQPVKVVAQGAGFSVANEGQAISSGSMGQTVRVRMGNGSILSATVVDKGVVETR
jgi:flagellar basal body P-ring formation protein FlgA